MKRTGFSHQPWPARLSGKVILLGVLLVTLSAGAAPPQIGYVYPAGGKAGSVFGVELGGQYLQEPKDVIISGEGVSAVVIDHDKLPPAAVVQEYGATLKQMRSDFRELGEDPDMSPATFHIRMKQILEEAGLSEKKVRQVARYRYERGDPKRQLNNQIGEKVSVRIRVEPDAEPGLRYLRLRTANGLSNPLRFVVGNLPEGNEPATWSFDLATYVGAKEKPARETLEDHSRTIRPPGTVNGRIMPGDVDEFYFEATEGDKMVIAVQARHLIPYLADAVPGWFQPVLSLFDPQGNEVAFADDYKFDPDPVIFYRVPSSGRYRIRIHDSIYRGREDFVYRITVGQLPFITGLFPLGGQAGSEVTLHLAGGNLPYHQIERYELPENPGIIPVTVRGDGTLSNAVPFHVDDVPESVEREPNNRLGERNSIDVPGLINGTIDVPGDEDFYRVEAGGGRPLTVEVFARRLGSPLDSSLTVYDSSGRQIAWNDDFENPAAGLTTHHADSRVTIKAPGGGTCFVRVADTQNRGGRGFAYRLKVTQDGPDFALRVTPASISGEAGGAAQCTVHVLRFDGFDGAVNLELKDAPEGFSLNNASIPAGQDSATVSIGLPNRPVEMPVAIALQGASAEDDGHPEWREVVPSEDMTQAFILNHFVTVDALMVDVREAESGPKKKESSR